MTVNICLLFLSVLFSFLSHPNFIFLSGLSFLSWFSYVPLFILVKRLSFKQSALAGFLFGFFEYAAICNWLITYNIWAALAVFFLFGIYWKIVFIAANRLKQNRYYIVFSCLIIFVFEYLSTKGYLGFSYGVSGYSQWNNALFVKAAKYTGVWGITFAIIAVNGFVSYILDCLINENLKKKKAAVYFVLSVIPAVSLLLTGMLVKEDFGEKQNVSFVLVQNNSDPWKDGIDQYIKEVEDLKNLTDSALEKNPEADIVVWPETAVVVDVINHYKLNRDTKRYEMAKDLFEYINSKKCCFLIGNNYLVYNSAVLFVPGKQEIPDYQVYSKNHLVPFSEDMPFKKLLKPLYNYMMEQGNSFWEKGSKVNLLKTEKACIGAPICFEDTFNEIPAKMKKLGANVFVNLTNDSWSDSAACQYQHLSMACFRSAENSIPTLRCTNSGQTCLIDSTGKVVKMLDPFVADTLYCEVKLNKVN